MERRNIFNRKNILIILGLALFCVVLYVLRTTGIMNGYHEDIFAQVCINIVLACGLNLITGFTGQFSLGHAGFMAIGAYTCGLILLNKPAEMPLMLAFFLGLLAGGCAAALVGILIGIPTLRLKGDYLAIATLGMAEIIRVVLLNLEITNGAAGLWGIPKTGNWFWLFLFAVATVIIINNFIRSSYGRACISIREDEIAAESAGVNATKYKIMAFAIGAFFAGLAGGLNASYFPVLEPKMFTFLKSVDMLIIVVAGGLGSLTGSVLVAVILTILMAILQAIADFRMIVYGLILVLLMRFRPQGLMGTQEIGAYLGRIDIPFVDNKKLKDWLGTK